MWFSGPLGFFRAGVPDFGDFRVLGLSGRGFTVFSTCRAFGDLGF